MGEYLEACCDLFDRIGDCINSIIPWQAIDRLNDAYNIVADQDNYDDE